MSHNRLPATQHGGYGRGSGQLGAAAPSYMACDSLTIEQPQTDSEHNGQSATSPSMHNNILCKGVRQTQSSPQLSDSAYMAQNCLINGRGQARPVGNAPPITPGGQIRAPLIIQPSHLVQNNPGGQRLRARPEFGEQPMANCNPRFDTLPPQGLGIQNRGMGVQDRNFSPRTQELPPLDTRRSGMNRDPEPIKLRVNNNSLLIRPVLNRQIGQPNQKYLEQHQELSQQFHTQSYQLPSQRTQKQHIGIMTKNSNSSLIVIPRRPEPHPSRWRWEDAVNIPPRGEGPVIPENKLGEDEKEEEEGEGEEGGGDCGEEEEDDDEEKKTRRSATFVETFVLLSVISRSPFHPDFVQHCPYLLEGRCKAASKHNKYCHDKLHFKRIIHAQTDIRLGDCSFLDSCDMADRCPYIHYQALFPKAVRRRIGGLVQEGAKVINEKEMEQEVEKEYEKEVVGGSMANEVDSTIVKLKASIQYPLSRNAPPQWIRCDITQLDLNILGKFEAIMADPPWDIRMTLPYGTVPDQAIIDLPFGNLQDEGLFFLWCTARTIDAGHACLRAWGYEFCDEIAWVKVDHLNRLISVGRTGHWLNHTMEHCLVGIKGNSHWIKKEIDMDVIVAQPRATSHKPDEIYEMIDHLVGINTRKLELFGREHNIRKGWLTLGNQLPHTHIHEKTLKNSYTKYLSRIGQSYTYNSGWNPWVNGFDRYGYGVVKDWRQERKISVSRNRNLNKGRNSRGNSHSSYSPRPGFRKDFQSIGRSQQSGTGDNSNKNQKSSQKTQQKSRSRKQQSQTGSQKCNEEEGQHENKQEKAGENTDIRDRASHNYPPSPSKDEYWSSLESLTSPSIVNSNGEVNDSDSDNSHGPRPETHYEGIYYERKGE